MDNDSMSNRINAGEVNKRSPLNLYIGVAMTCIAATLTGTSFIITKKALQKLAKRSIRAAAGGHGYLREPVWWMGMGVNAMGEICNFTAFSFAPASIVSPLNGLSVVVTAILSARFLNDKLNLIGKVACCLALIGATNIVIHAPRTSGPQSLNEMTDYVNNPVFVSYLILVLIIVGVFIIYVAPRYGMRWIFVYLSICSLVGSLTVINAKIFGLTIGGILSGQPGIFENFLTYTSAVGLIICIMSQVKYLNMALDAFNTPIVICIYYVMFSSTVIASSSVLFQEFSTLNHKDIIGICCGFLTVALGVFQLNAFRQLDINLNSISTRKPAQEFCPEQVHVTYAAEPNGDVRYECDQDNDDNADANGICDDFNDHDVGYTHTQCAKCGHVQTNPT